MNTREEKYKTHVGVIILYIKFLVYGGIAAYDYSIGSKYTIAWLILALIVLAFAIVSDIQTYIDFKFKNQSV